MTGIGSESKKEFKHFDYDTRALTSFELTNQLWGLIGQVCDDTYH